MSTPKPEPSGPPLRALAMVLIALAILLRGYRVWRLPCGPTRTRRRPPPSCSDPSSGRDDHPRRAPDAGCRDAAGRHLDVRGDAPRPVTSAPRSADAAAVPVRVLNNSNVTGLAAPDGHRTRGPGAGRCRKPATTATAPSPRPPCTTALPPARRKPRRRSPRSSASPPSRAFPGIADVVPRRDRHRHLRAVRTGRSRSAPSPAGYDQIHFFATSKERFDGLRVPPVAMSWRVVAPMVAIAAVGLTACRNNEEPTDVPGTTPPVWTGAADAQRRRRSRRAESGHAVRPRRAARSRRRCSNADGRRRAAPPTFRRQAATSRSPFPSRTRRPASTVSTSTRSASARPNSVAPTGAHRATSCPPAGTSRPRATRSPASGDLTSLQVHDDGTAELVTTTDAFTVEDLQNGDSGTAVVVHSGSDNFANIPTRYAPAR